MKTNRVFFLGLLALLWTHSLAKPSQEPRDPASRLGSVSGHITVEGKPAATLGLSLFKGDAEWGKPVATAFTREDGRYHFSELLSAHYWIKVESPDYVNAGGLFYNRTGRLVSVADGQSVENADLDLIRAGVISGRVQDMNRFPIANEPVQLTPTDGNFTMRAMSPSTGAFTTDSTGAYRIIGIPPGNYLVSIGEDMPRLRGDVRDDFGSSGRVKGDYYYEQTFYPGSTERQKAQIIRVVAGSEVQRIDIMVGRQQRSFKVSGRVVDARTGQGVGSCGLQLMQRVNNGYRGASTDWFQHDNTDENGNFTISGLIPGRFFIGATFKEGKTDLYGRPVDFDVIDSDITGLAIKAYHGIALEGKLVLVEGNKDAAAKAAQLKASAWLTTDEFGSIDTFRDAIVNGDGAFRIDGLRPGTADIHLDPSDTSSFFSLVRVEYPDADDETQLRASPADALQRCRLEVGDRSLKGVRIVLAYQNASIKGRVAIVGNIPASVQLYAWVSRSNNVSLPPLDANGEFTLEGLEPGDYEVSIGDRSRRLTEPKLVKVQKNTQATVSFVLDMNRQ